MDAIRSSPELNAEQLAGHGITLNDLEPGLVELVIDRPDDRVNAINQAFIEGLGAAVETLQARPDLRGVIVRSGKPGQFVAGADLNELLRASSVAEGEAAVRAFQRALNGLASLPCPVVAAIDGAALGGGCELALACDARIATNQPAVSIGLPETRLGLIPAGGGCQRLPRVVGLARAIELITAGRRLNARQALRLGLVDELVHPADLLQAAVARAPRPKAARPGQRAASARGLLARLPAALEATSLGRQLIYRRARRRLERETRGRYPAPLAALEAIAIGRESGLAAGLEQEARSFGRLVAGETARRLITLFLEIQRQRHQPAVDEPGVAPRPVERVGVVGAGLMGAGIAQACAVAGLPVRLRDVSPGAVASGLARLTRLTREAGQKGLLSRQEAEQAARRVSGSLDYSGFARADLAIEAVVEDLAVKRQVMTELEAVLPETAVIASNTSSLPIAQLAAELRHPERVVGMHFFSPVHRMPLLEVVRAPSSAPWAVATAVEVGRRLGKTVIVVSDGPGFYTTRVLGFMLNEAGLALEEGADMASLDQAMLELGFPVGPFVLLDEIGLDVTDHVADTLRQAFGGRFIAARGVRRLVEHNRLGRKSGRGFYLYGQRQKQPDPDVYRLLGLREPPARPRTVTPWEWALHRQEEIEALRERLLLLFVNEAARCLDEGVLRPVDGDLGAVLGVGFPAYLGGPFRYADRYGLAQLCQRLQALRQAHGERFAPAAGLAALAERGETFYPA